MGLLLIKHRLDLLVNNLADNGSPSVQDYSARGEDDYDQGDGPRVRDGSLDEDSSDVDKACGSN